MTEGFLRGDCQLSITNCQLLPVPQFLQPKLTRTAGESGIWPLLKRERKVKNILSIENAFTLISNTSFTLMYPLAPRCSREYKVAGKRRRILV